ncbi:hypothetical protein Pmar_PMAR013336 [Perkinsus marinus ATCC 50983]|uniref:Uncharacterized protein n=1 Tax=Perkinsus marinus (strain ATCC 50983 / TXsc) TaxID=423536 RepID=C5L6N5_PERM5|nr:hypothetical protein Pmar_PMAR013336 [Perkinsus marinus ATCC 50983]EER07609.1 hypothetical protein Pmar_PMAR013336 [Perkinsus marinus ATCC 50983]|eukprot:XP_002775793.1 hypothetical protein Pmar_PMAR013336 [Perkinsus marinus ATCC 50983]
MDSQKSIMAPYIPIPITTKATIAKTKWRSISHTGQGKWCCLFAFMKQAMGKRVVTCVEQKAPMRLTMLLTLGITMARPPSRITREVRHISAAILHRPTDHPFLSPMWEHIASICLAVV